jgi:hypothetical protein
MKKGLTLVLEEPSWWSSAGSSWTVTRRPRWRSCRNI